MLLGLGLTASVKGVATTLGLGDLQVLGATTDTEDSFSFVLWTDIGSGTVIRFMDSSFTSTAGTTVDSGEDSVTITFNSVLSAGTVVRWVKGGGPGGNPVVSVNGGTFTGSTSGEVSLKSSGDQVFAYQGSDVTGTSFSGRTLLYGLNLANAGWITSGTANENNSYLPTVIAGQDNSLAAGAFDNAQYSGVRSGMTESAYRASIGNILNYTTSDTRFDLTTTGFASATSMSLFWDADGNGAGSGGTGGWDDTTQSRFKKGASGTTNLHWVNAAAGNYQSAVFGGTAGTVTVATGGVTSAGLQFDVTGYTLAATGAGKVTLLNSSTPAVNVATSTTAIVTAPLAGTGGFNKTGLGVMDLRGTNTITGAVGVTAGALIVGGTLTPAVNVSNAATLAGAGTVSGLVTVASGGNLAPGSSGGVGASAGVLTSGGGFSLSAGSRLVLEVGGTGATGYDRVLASGGTVTLAGDVAVSLFGTYTETVGDKFFVIINNGLNAVSGGFSNAVAGVITFASTGLKFSVNYADNAGSTYGGNGLNNNDVSMTLIAVPEPSGVCLLLGGVSLLMGLGRGARGIRGEWTRA